MCAGTWPPMMDALAQPGHGKEEIALHTRPVLEQGASIGHLPVLQNLKLVVDHQYGVVCTLDDDLVKAAQATRRGGCEIFEDGSVGVDLGVEEWIERIGFEGENLRQAQGPYGDAAGTVVDEGELPKAFTLGQGAQPFGLALDGRIFDRDLVLEQNE